MAAAGTAGRPGAATVRGNSARVVIGVLVTCGLSVSLVQTMVVPLLPQFADAFEVSVANATWLVTSTLLAGAVFTPTFSRLADLHGRRRLLLIALGTLLAGSALGAIAGEFWVLVAARTLQGAAVAVVALGISLMRDALPPDRLHTGVALMSASLGFGGAVGLPLAGIVAQFADWRWLFVGLAVLAAALMISVVQVVPETAVRATGTFDVVGAVLLAAALLGLLLAVSEGTDLGWTSPELLTLLLTSTAALVLWVVLMLRRPSPLIDLRVVFGAEALLINVTALVVAFAVYTSFLITPQILQADIATGYGFGLPVATVGLVLVPSGLTMTLFAPISVRVSRRFGEPISLVFGAAAIGATCLVLAALPGSVLVYILCGAISGVGVSLAYSAMPVLVMAAAPSTDTAVANGVNALVRMIGTSCCSAFVAAVLSAYSAPDGTPPGAAFTLSFLVSAGCASVAAVLALALTRNRARGRTVPVSAAGPLHK